MSTPAAFHLAQINVARVRSPLGDPIMAEFEAALAEINALAEASPGFVWRLKEENDNATSPSIDVPPSREMKLIRARGALDAKTFDVPLRSASTLTMKVLMRVHASGKP